MNDRRINDLVRMAIEVEELEADVASPQLRLVGESDGAPTVRRAGGSAWWWGIGLAAAAGLALALILPSITPSGPASNPKDLAINSDSPASATPNREIIRHIPLAQNQEPVPSRPIAYPVAANAPDRIDPGLVERCMVMAIFRGPHGQMHCVKVKPHEWSDNKCLSEITPQELRCVSVGQSCSSSADHALVVALSGPQKNLPRTENDAVSLAACILGGSPCENDAKCYSLSAAECLPAGVSVKIETIADSR